MVHVAFLARRCEIYIPGCVTFVLVGVQEHCREEKKMFKTCSRLWVGKKCLIRIFKNLNFLSGHSMQPQI